MTKQKESILIISEGGAGLPVPETTHDSDPSRSRRLHLDSAFLNVITSLLLAKRLVSEGHEVKLRFGIQYFTSANEYHIPESFEEEFYRESSRKKIGKDVEEYLNIFNIDNEEQRIKIALHLELFREYVSRAIILYSVETSEFHIPEMFNTMGKLQKAVRIAHNPITDQNDLLGKNPNEITKIVMEKIVEILELKNRIEILFDEGPKLRVDSDWLIDNLPENLKELRDTYRIKMFGHVFTFLRELGYEPPDSLPIVIPSEYNETYNGIRYLFNHKNWIKAVRTYMGSELGYFGSKRVDREELIRRIKEGGESMYLKFPLAVFEGEMISPMESADELIDPERFRAWIDRNRESAEKYDRIYLVEGLEGSEGNPHTIGLREKIVRHFAGESKFVRIKSPVEATILDVNRYDLEEIVNRVEKTHPE